HLPLQPDPLHDPPLRAAAVEPAEGGLDPRPAPPDDGCGDRARAAEHGLPAHAAGGRGRARRPRSRGAPRLRPPTNRAGLADPAGVKSDLGNGAAAHLVSGHPPIAPASRTPLEWKATWGTEPRRSSSQATHQWPRPPGT